MNSHRNSTIINIPSSRSYTQGKFGRMFPWLESGLSDTNETRLALKKLGQLMYGGENLPKNKTIPAGYTYLGQFIAHDISFDNTSINSRQIDREHLRNFRTPALDLDCLYGGGPLVQPYLYEDNGVHFNIERRKIKKSGFQKKAKLVFDLPRSSSKRKKAIIPDSRNDENLIVSQLHVIFLRFHNKIVDIITKGKKNVGNRDFKIAKNCVRWHYQWLILNDYLPKIVDLSEFPENNDGETTKEQIDKIVYERANRLFYDWKNAPFIPLEFSAAAFRLGHSQVLKNYRFNLDMEQGVSLFQPNLADKTPFASIDWELFFDNDGLDSHSIDPFISINLADIPVEGLINRGTSTDDLFNQYEQDKDREKLQKALVKNVEMTNRFDLATMNLIRGLTLRLPSGQSIRKAMKLPELDKFEKAKEIEQIDSLLLTNTPLWYYILEEASQKNNGEKLGSVGSRIVAEVIIGLMHGDKNSFINQDPNWQAGIIGEEKFEIESMMDLINFVES